MDNTTEQVNTQDQLSPEEAKASLGLATRLSEEFMMSQVPQEGGEEASEAPVEAQEPQGEEMDPEEDTAESKMAMKNEMRTMIQEEMAILREDIQKALTDEEE